MSRANRLANHIERTVTGPMWHGPALHDVLKGVTSDQARARPLPGAHSIWELALHITAWCDIARSRLTGQALGDPTPGQDFPEPGSVPHSGSDPAWDAAVERLAESHRRLAADVRALSDDQLKATVKEDHTIFDMLHGVVEHGTYHGGQIALLRKA